MKKITILLVLLCASLSIGSAQEKRAYFSSIPNEKISSPSDFVGKNNAVSIAPNLQHINSMVAKDKNINRLILPSYLSIAAEERVFILSDKDTSDSATILTSYIDPSKKTRTGIYNLPAGLIGLQSGTHEMFGCAQFFDPFAASGTFKIDTVALDVFVYQTHADGSPFPQVKQSVLLFAYKTSKNLRTAANNDIPLSSLEQIGNEIEISADAINSLYDASTQSYKKLIVTVDPPWVVNGNEMYGFGVYPMSNKDTMNVLGTHMWQEKDPNRTLGYLLHRVSAGSDESALRQSGIIFPLANNPQLAPFPSLYDKPLKVNYNVIVGGMLEITSSVETLSDDARAFALEPVSPNPVMGATKIQFSLQQPSHVSLRVTNSLGQVVKELASGAMNTGTYSADFDANDLPTGMYYYTLVAGTQSLTRSMVVVK